MDRHMLEPAEDSGGFTLIELLVVIIVIGILAAIALPVFLNQRKKGWDAQAKSDLRNLAHFEEIYLIDRDSYGTIAQIEAAEPTYTVSPRVTVGVETYDTGKGYCLSALSPSGKRYLWDSQNGGLQPDGTTNCPVTTTGLPGDTLTGP